MSSPFQISTELFGHEGAVRVAAAIEVTEKDTPATKTLKLITGAMDSVVKCWTRSADGSYVESLNIYDHEHWITAMISIPETTGSGFITGCMDKKIRLYSQEGILVSILTGHEGGIICFGFTKDGHLISGSWDGTARVWDLKKGICIGVLSGHENGVCVLGLPNGTIVTGSTGKQVENTVVDFQLRFWNQDFTLQKTLKDHTGPIRELAIVPEIGFCSCSNDGSIKVRTLDGQVVATMAHPLNGEGKPGFVLGVTVLCPVSKDQGGGSLIVSASEDCTARVWSIQGDLIQTIEHPGGLWGVACLPNGDFVTCCEDKVARVFTASSERYGNPQVVANFASSVEEAKLVRQRGPSGVEIDQLPDYERRFELDGKSDGQIQMFQKNKKAWACQWSQPSKTWTDIGEVTGTGSGGVVDGEAYDLVIPVEIEMPGSGQVRKLEIGYNQGQNPFQVAQEFINKHMLDQSYLSQIADYISQRSSEYRPPIIEDATSLESSTTIHSASQVTSGGFEFFPSKAYNTFETTKISKLLSTVEQFNSTKISSEKIKASPKELDLLAQIVKTVQETAFYHSSTFSSQEMSTLVALIRRWTPEFVFPLLDLARLVLIHPQGAKALASQDTFGSIFIERVLELGTSEGDAVPMATRMLALRVVANLFFQPQARQSLVQYKHQVISSLGFYLAFAKENKLVALSLSTVVFNFGHLAHSSTNSITLEDAKEIVHVSIELLIAALQQELGDDTILRCLICLGTLTMIFPIKPLVQEKLLKLKTSIEGTSSLKNYWKEMEQILEI